MSALSLQHTIANAAARILRFEIHRAGEARWRWRCISDAGEVVAGGDSYDNADDCRRVVDLLRTSALAAVLEQVS